MGSINDLILAGKLFGGGGGGGGGGEPYNATLTINNLIEDTFAVYDFFGNLLPPVIKDGNLIIIDPDRPEEIEGETSTVLQIAMIPGYSTILWVSQSFPEMRLTANGDCAITFDEDHWILEFTGGEGEINIHL